jgi:hypothetical protein
MSLTSYRAAPSRATNNFEDFPEIKTKKGSLQLFSCWLPY